MGQLVIRFRVRNPRICEITKEVSLMSDEAKEVEGLTVEEVILDGEVFVRQERTRMDDRNETPG